MTTRFSKEYHLNLLCHHITNRSGIGFDERKRKQLKELVEARCALLGLNHMGDYCEKLFEASLENDEFSILMDSLTIQESFFFRQKAQFHALRHLCLPQLMDRRKRDPKDINIWSAGCANGEEAYSIAMLIWDVFPNNPQAKFYIRGTDISRQAIQKAREGIYPKRAVRDLDPHYLDRYFKEQKNQYVLKADIKDMVDFKYQNLSEDPFPRHGMPPWDIIFCRNVIIYFTTDHSRKLMKNFYGSMVDGGFLFAGFSETMRYLNEDFVPIQMDDAFIYQKPFSSQPSTPVISVSENRSRYRPKKDSTRKPTRSINQTGSVERQSRNRTPMRLEMKKALPEPPKQTPSETTKSLNDRISLARRLSDLGETMEAVAILDQIIHQDPLHARAYFMLAMIYRNAGNLEQSCHYLKKVVYLEPDNPLARLHLADIFKAESRDTDAAREYSNVISLMENQKIPETDVFEDGFTAQALLNAARAHLRLLRKIE